MSDPFKGLSDIDKKAFLIHLPQMLAEWYNGEAMFETYKVRASWSNDRFVRFYKWMKFLAKAVPSSPTVLYRGIEVPTATAPKKGSVIRATPRNALHSWAVSLNKVQEFHKDIVGRNYKKCFVIMETTMPANRIGLSVKDRIILMKWIEANLVDLAKVFGSESPTFRNVIKNRWQEVRYTTRMIGDQGEVICLDTTPLKVKIVDVLSGR